MKAEVFTIEGKKIKVIELPEQFNEEYRQDLIKRAILAIRSHGRQPYGTMSLAGQGYSAKLSRRRRDYKGAYGKGISRVSRKTMWRRGMQFGWVGAIVPGTVGGRRAHPPKAEKKWEQKINNKERKKAIRSALAGTAQKKIMIIENKFEDLKKTREVKKILNLFGLTTDKIKRNKAGKGKNKGRNYRYKKNPLIIVSKKCDVANVVPNLPGYDVVNVKNLNPEILSLNHNEPRPCIFTEGSIEILSKERLFFDKK